MAVPPVSSATAVVHPEPGPTATPQAEPVIILDWDDTLLPNTHLAILGFSDETKPFALTNENQRELDALAHQAEELLRQCLRLGRCFIVTNGQDGWVERSCKRFLPSLAPMLARVTILSARDKYEKRYPRSPVDWKIQAFGEVLARDDVEQEEERDPEPAPECPTIAARPRCLRATQHVVALGDSPHDRSAIQYIGKRHEHLRVKSVKFLENPTMAQLRKQLTLMTGFLPQLCAHEEDLDLVLSAAMLR